MVFTVGGVNIGVFQPFNVANFLIGVALSVFINKFSFFKMCLTAYNRLADAMGPVDGGPAFF
ncbi:hypothetical protein, partial [Salmonella enterica]|uniref:hypothetical protein n=1 Tax=Salmonella enterica TaxID=28901 RepID=UPI0020C239C7